MDLKAGWLLENLRQWQAAFDAAGARENWLEFSRQNRALGLGEKIRRYFDLRLRQTGLVYGTPLASSDEIGRPGESTQGKDLLAFVAICRIQVQLALEMASAMEHPTNGPQVLVELLALFALLRRKRKLAEALDRMKKAAEDQHPPRRLFLLALRVERELLRQAYLAGNPLLGLPVHNSLNYSDAKTFGRLAIAYYEHGLLPGPIKRIWQYQDQERVLLLRAMLGLALADRPVTGASRAVIRRQLRKAGLSFCQRWKLLGISGKDTKPMAVAAAAENDRLRDFILEQVILGAMLDGHMSQAESDYISQLAGWLAVPPEELARLEMEVLAFYERHRQFMDIFTVSEAVQSWRERWLDRLENALRSNRDKILKEVKNTGELAELLMRAARGEKLTAEERRRMTQGLIDVLRTIPSLAIFALPGGMLLLPLALKFLPDELKPRSFTDRSD